MGETRKLAAILVADVVGYSRLAGADEDRILARLRTLRSDLIDPIISVHHGRIVKRTVDGSIIEVDASRRATAPPIPCFSIPFVTFATLNSLEAGGLTTQARGRSRRSRRR